VEEENKKEGDGNSLNQAETEKKYSIGERVWVS